jgi:hypothetical protein
MWSRQLDVEQAGTYTHPILRFVWMVDRIASTPGLLDALRVAHARARVRFWELHGVPERLTLDVGATLITAPSEKEQAAGNDKGGYGFHPLQVYLDETREALGGLLRPGNAGSNPAEDRKTVIDLALAQIPVVGSRSPAATPSSTSSTHGRGQPSPRRVRGAQRSPSPRQRLTAATRPTHPPSSTLRPRPR